MLCPFFNDSYFETRCLTVFGTSNKIPFLGNFYMIKIMTRNMLTKNAKKSRRQIWQNVIILLSFCYHLANHIVEDIKLRHCK